MYERAVDRILVEGLEVEASVGVYAHERGALRRLLIDLAVSRDITAAASTDDLRQTLDYDHLAALCRKVVDAGHLNLIETVAERIAQQILLLAGVQAVQVRVAKPGAVPHARQVAVQIIRQKP